MPHQMGIDLGLSNDGTAFVITYIDGDKIALAYHELWEAGRDWRESNPHLQGYSCDYAKKIGDVNQLDFDEIANWIVQISKRFYITDALFDRWNGTPLQQHLTKRGITQFKSEFFTKDDKSKMFQAAKMLMIDQKLSLYDYPIPQNGDNQRHSQFIAELLTLQAHQVSRNLVEVAAPQQSGYHDDLSDAFIRAVWLSQERMVNTKYAFGGHQERAGRPNGGTIGRYQMQRAKAHGGFTTDRMVPRNLGLRGGRRR